MKKLTHVSFWTILLLLLGSFSAVYAQAPMPVIADTARHEGHVLAISSDLLVIEAVYPSFAPPPVTEVVSITLTAETMVSDGVVEGAYVVVYSNLNEQGQLQAIAVSRVIVIQEPTMVPTPVHEYAWGEGEIISSTETSITIADINTDAGLTFAITPNSVIEGSVELGGWASIKGEISSDGTYVAYYIYARGEIITPEPSAEFYGQGTIIALSETSVTIDLTTNPDAVYIQPYPPVVDQVELQITPNTMIDGELAVGSYVMFKGERQADGTVIALGIRVSEPRPEMVYAEGEIVELGESSVTVAMVTMPPTPEPDYDENGQPILYPIDPIVEMMTFSINSDTVVDGGELAIGSYAMIKGARTPDGAMIANVIYVKEPQPEYIRVEGEVVELTDASITVLTILYPPMPEPGTGADGEPVLYPVDPIAEQLIFAITTDTVIEGDVAVGKRVIVKAIRTPEGELSANYIAVLESRPMPVYAEGEVVSVTETSLTLEMAQLPMPMPMPVDGAVTSDGSPYPNGGTITFVLTPDTEVDGELVEGALVFVNGFSAADGTFVAKYVKVRMHENEHVFVDGPIEEFTDSTIVVGGQLFNLSPETHIMGEPTIGRFARVGGVIDAAGQLWAVRIEVQADRPIEEKIVAEGQIEAYGEGTITVNGQTFVISETTQTMGTPEVGKMAFVIGSADANGVITAIFIQVHESPVVYPVQDDLVRLSGVISEIYAEKNLIVVDERIVALTAETEIQGELAVGSEVGVLARTDAEGQLTALKIYVRQSEPEQTPQPEYAGHIVKVMGLIEAVSNEMITVDGRTFQIVLGTEIEGELVVNTQVIVVGEITRDGKLIAFHIEVMDGGEDSHDDHEGVMGKVTAIGTDFIIIRGQEFLINATSTISGTPVVGDMVYVTLNGRTVVYLEIVQPHDEENEQLPVVPPTTIYRQTLEIMDLVTGLGEGTVQIAGETIVLGQARIIGQLTIGEPAYIIASRTTSDGDWVAEFVEALSKQEGHVDDINNGEITVDGVKHIVGRNTRVLGNITVGMRVRIGMTANPARSANAINTYIQPLSSVPTAVTLSNSSVSNRGTIIVVSLLVMGAVLTVGMFRFGRNNTTR